jgi:hypothetical protein
MEMRKTEGVVGTIPGRKFRLPGIGEKRFGEPSIAKPIFLVAS